MSVRFSQISFRRAKQYEIRYLTAASRHKRFIGNRQRNISLTPRVS